MRASDVAYERLRDMIIDLRLRPGIIVDEMSLAAEIALGRTPVHEAVARLVGDRLVTVLPRRGLMIAPIGLEEVREIFEAREAIECGNAYFAVHHATDAELAELRHLVEQAENAREETDAQRFLDDDQLIHRFLARCMHNSFLQDATDRILLHSLRFWRFYFTTYHVADNTLISHQALLSALERRDAQEASMLMREHILTSRALLNALF
ncbi:MAG TPA: GntR family transcriptional regulator [Ktedonobacteraceae bacterium]|nr:GntR family transcriptional regulator [Ktedonobacteraceae bacterium]